MDKPVSLQSLVVEKYTQLLRAAMQGRNHLLGKATPIPVAVRITPAVRVPVSRRRRRAYF